MPEDTSYKWFGLVRTVLVAMLIGSGGVILNWVAVINRTTADVGEIKGDLIRARVATETLQDKVDQVLSISFDIKSQTRVNTESILFLKELSVQNARAFSEIRSAISNQPAPKPNRETP